MRQIYPTKLKLSVTMLALEVNRMAFNSEKKKKHTVIKGPDMKKYETTQMIKLN